MGDPTREFLTKIKVTTLTAIVVASFIFSSLGWRHFESSESTRVIVAAIILFVMYCLIIFELVNRNLAALIGATMAVAAYDCLIEFADIKEIVQWEDLETLSLLFGMMIIVNVLGSSGLFKFLAIWSYKKSGGRFWSLIVLISIFTAVLSAFIDNVSTMLLMAPTLIELSELEHIDPRYLLMIMVLISNVGGCTTPVGDPPNIIIINDELTISQGINFGYFVAICSPGGAIIVACLLIYLRLFYKSKDSFRLRPHKTAISLCEEGANQRGQPSFTNKTQLVDELKALESSRKELSVLTGPVTDSCASLVLKLDEQIEKHEQVVAELNGRETFLAPEMGSKIRRGSRLDDAEIDALFRAHSIKNKPILIQSLAVLVISISLFFAQSIPGSNLTLGWVSLFAGISLLVLSSSSSFNNDTEEDDDNAHDKGCYKTEEHQDGFEAIISRVEWSTLLFFAALFIVMEVMDKLGLIMFFGRQVTQLVDLLPMGTIRSIGSITIVLWASGFASACIDNVPFTSMMIKVVGAMEWNQSGPNISGVKPLIFSLVFGACLGGSATLIGASANLITASISGRHGYPITYNSFLKFSAPLTVGALFVANLYLVVVFVFLGL